MRNLPNYFLAIGVLFCATTATHAGPRGRHGLRMRHQAPAVPDACPCGRHCKMVVKSVPVTTYEAVDETLFRIEYDTVHDTKVVKDVVRYPVTTYECVPFVTYRPVFETRTRPITTYVNVPFYEHKSRTIHYTTYHPVHELKTRTVPYTTYRTVCEPQTRVITTYLTRVIPEVKTAVRHFVVYRPVCQNLTRNVTYYTYRPVYEQKTYQAPYVVYHPITETRTVQVPYTVTRIVPETRTVPYHTGSWVTRQRQIPGPTITRSVQSPGVWKWDPCTCRCIYVPGPCKQVQVQCPPRTICEKVWVPRIEQRVVKYSRCIAETHYRPVTQSFTRVRAETRYRTHAYTVCRYVAEPHTRTENYTVVRQIPEKRSQTYCYTVNRYVREPHTRTVTINVKRVIPEHHTCQQTYTVCRWVPQQHSCVQHYTVCRYVRQPKTSLQTYTVVHKVAEEHTRQVARTIWQSKPITKSICTPRTVTRKVPYTITRWVPKTCMKKICVPVCVANGGKGGGKHSTQKGGGASPNSLDGEGEISTAAPRSYAPAPHAAVAADAALPADAPAEVQFNEALARLQAGRFEEAVRGFSRAAQQSPNRAAYLYYLALAQRRSKNLKAATLTLQQAVRRERANPSEQLGRLLQRVQGDDRLWIEKARADKRIATASL